VSAPCHWFCLSPSGTTRWPCAVGTWPPGGKLRRTTRGADSWSPRSLHAEPIGVVARCVVCHWRSGWFPAPLLQRVGRELCQGWDHCAHGPRWPSRLHRVEPKNRALFSATTKQVTWTPHLLGREPGLPAAPITRAWPGSVTRRWCPREPGVGGVPPVRPGVGIGTALAVAIEEEHVAVPAVVAAHLGATVRAVPGIGRGRPDDHSAA
jgi:hypothetical protein